MPLSNRKVWIFSVTPENWLIVASRNIWGVKSDKVRKRIARGDVIVFFVKGSRPPCFMGAYEVVSDWYPSTEITWHDEQKAGKIIYPFKVDIRPIQLGTANVKNLLDKLSFIEHKDAWSTYLMGAPANFKRPISEEDFQIILDELRKPPVNVSFRPISIEEKPPKEVLMAQSTTSPITHKDLVNMIKEIGEMLCFVVRVEDFTPDRIYRCDVTWRDYEEHPPLKVFEVEVSGNVDHALASLAHAYDVWRPESLYLVVLDERDLERAKKLIEPRLKGAFSRLRGKLRVLTWKEITTLYSILNQQKDLIKELASRGAS
jgi:predicted RNA-binding protein